MAEKRPTLTTTAGAPANSAPRMPSAMYAVSR